MRREFEKNKKPNERKGKGKGKEIKKRRHTGSHGRISEIVNEEAFV
jgi:hypothetical protein